MSRSWVLFLEDMLEAARKIARYTAQCDFATFADQELIYDGTLRNLEVLGEAAKKIPPDVRERHPEIDWRGTAGLRDVLSHAYFALDTATLWKIATEEVPRLLAQLEQVRERERPTGD